MSEVVQLPGMKPDTLRVLCVLAVMPHGVKASLVYQNIDIPRQVVYRELDLLTSLKWLTRDERRLYRVTPDGVRLAQMWQLVHGLRTDASLPISPIQAPTGSVAVRVRQARKDLCLSQAGLAAAMREAGEKLGRQNRCTKRLVQKWESGEHTAMRDNYEQALALLTGRLNHTRAGRRAARHVVVGANALMEVPGSDGSVSAGWWMGTPVAVAELADRLGQTAAELARIQVELAQLSRAPIVGR